MSDRRCPRAGLALEDDSGLALPLPGRWEVPIELWGRFVAHARRCRGLSQTALAEAAGVTQQTISKVEMGDICPHDRLKARLARALDVPTTDLFPWPTKVVATSTGGCAWPIVPGPRAPVDPRA